MSERGDVIDQANDKTAALVASTEAEIRYQAQHMPAGECDLCGELSGRLVRGVCAPCRDKYRLP